MTRVSDKHMSLYEEAEDGTITLGGMICTSCHHISFPAQSYGCEKCGAFGDALRSRKIEAQGQLLAFARVNLHRGKGIKAPFLVGSIQLDDGPSVRCTLIEQEDSELSHGAPMIGKIVQGLSLDDGTSIKELRFGRA
jgi:uncharacterized OB-fold protein